MGGAGLGVDHRGFDAFFVPEWLEAHFCPNHPVKRWSDSVFWTVQRASGFVFAVSRA